MSMISSDLYKRNPAILDLGSCDLIKITKTYRCFVHVRLKIARPVFISITECQGRTYYVK
jgi:hypothetical protein